MRCWLSSPAVTKNDLQHFSLSIIICSKFTCRHKLAWLTTLTNRIHNGYSNIDSCTPVAWKIFHSTILPQTLDLKIYKSLRKKKFKIDPIFCILAARNCHFMNMSKLEYFLLFFVYFILETWVPCFGCNREANTKRK